MNGGIFQVAAPYLELPSLARVRVDLLARGLEVLGGAVRLNMCMEVRGLVERGWRSILAVIINGHSGRAIGTRW